MSFYTRNNLPTNWKKEFSKKSIHDSLNNLISAEAKLKFIKEKKSAINLFMKANHLDDAQKLGSNQAIVKKVTDKELKPFIVLRNNLLRRIEELKTIEKEIVKKESESKKPSFIFWHKDFALLNKFYQELVRHKFIYDQGEKLFASNFCFDPEDCAKSATNTDKVNWLKAISHLIFLINKMSEKGFIDNNSIWITVPQVFTNRGKEINEGSLRSMSSRLKKQKRSIPETPRSKINEIIKDLVNTGS
ncbi:MAG: hypothetical protein K9I36_16835 [Bacteroidia bacterium]|nr:hypothetical protein [Bacteroidia bacterium]